MRKFDNTRAGLVCIVVAVTGVSSANASLIGVDFDVVGGVSPTNWSLDSTSHNHTLTNLIDENGLATGVDLSVNVGNGPNEIVSSTIPADQIPSHANLLIGLDGNIASDETLTLTWSNLVPNRIYDLFVFGNDIFEQSQLVTITGAGVPLSFSQTFSPNTLFVNSSLGSNAQLDTFAIPVTSDAVGTIQIFVENGQGQDAALAGLAIQRIEAVSEPGTLAVFGLGLASLAWRRRRLDWLLFER